MDESVFRKIFWKFATYRMLTPLVVLICVYTTFYFFEPGFLSIRNISFLLAYIPELGLIALGMTFLLTAREFDLSVGSVFGFCPVFLFILFNEGVVGFELAFILALTAAALIGLTNGLLVTKFKINSLLVTVGMMMVFRGLTLFISFGFPQPTAVTGSFVRTLLIGSFKHGDCTIYAGLFWFIILAGLMYFVLNHTKFGNWIFATGGNIESAKARGINTDWIKIILFTLTALLAGLAGTIDTMRLGSAYPTAGTGYELEIIAMTVIGGTSLYGGRGTVIGTIIGVVLLRSIRNGIIIIGVPGLAYRIFVGSIILIMMSVYSIIERETRIG